jgi:hypothetical protein
MSPSASRSGSKYPTSSARKGVDFVKGSIAGVTAGTIVGAYVTVGAGAGAIWAACNSAICYFCSAS